LIWSPCPTLCPLTNRGVSFFLRLPHPLTWLRARSCRRPSHCCEHCLFQSILVTPALPPPTPTTVGVGRTQTIAVFGSCLFSCTSPLPPPRCLTCFDRPALNDLDLFSPSGSLANGAFVSGSAFPPCFLRDVVLAQLRSPFHFHSFSKRRDFPWGSLLLLSRISTISLFPNPTFFWCFSILVCQTCRRS